MLAEVSHLPGDFPQWISHMADLINKLKKVQLKSALHGKYISQDGPKPTHHQVLETSNSSIINQLLMETLQLHKITSIGKLMTTEFHLVWMHLK
tara:strand:+ start:80 stop:361 length:282 start_codon:yes stop_codon:yes gene_type:complete